MVSTWFVSSLYSQAARFSKFSALRHCPADSRCSFWKKNDGSTPWIEKRFPRESDLRLKILQLWILSMQWLENSYEGIRRARGDGNCFFRSFMFSYLVRSCFVADTLPLPALLRPSLDFVELFHTCCSPLCIQQPPHCHLLCCDEQPVLHKRWLHLPTIPIYSAPGKHT